MPITDDDFQFLLSLLKKRHPSLAKERALVVRALDSALGRARAKWPHIQLSDRAFLEGLARRVLKADGVVSGLAALRTSDLYAALAAATGDPQAVEGILEHCRPDIQKTLRSIKLDGTEFDEVLQRLRVRIFVAAPGESPRILGYSGSGSLGAWLAAAATRLAIDLKRSNSDVVDEFDEKLTTVLSNHEDIELNFMKQKYRREFRQTFQEVFASLTRDDRNLLRLTFLDGLSIDQLSPLLGVHRSSVARRIAKLRQTLASGTQSRLRAKLNLSKGDLDSLVRLVTSAFDISLAQVLKEPRTPSLSSRRGSRGGGAPE